MGLMKRFTASSTHNKLAVGMVALGAFIAALILTVHYQGIDGRGGQKEMELGELWVVVGFFMVVAPLVVKWDERRLRNAARRRAAGGGER